MRVMAIDLPGKLLGGFVVVDDTKPDHIVFGDLKFNPNSSEVSDYRVLWDTLELWHPDLLIIERAFLYMIAGGAGAAKMWVAARNKKFFQIAPSSAKKICLGKGNSSKNEVFAWASRHPQAPQKLTQHMSDALLYYQAWRLQQ